MIEQIRKYTGLIVVVFVLVIIGFIFMDTSTMRAAGGGNPYLKIDGRKYTDREFRSLGAAPYELTQMLAQSGDFPLYTFLFTLSGDAQSQEQAVENFFTNRILLRNAKEEFGIYPGNDEIDSFIRQLRAFTSPDGAFSQEQYRTFIERGIGRLGLTESDVRELASDVLAQRKLAEILGSGLATNREIVAKDLAIENQRLNVNVARIDMDPIEAKIEPTEEEIKAYWETVQDAFKTEERRRFTYLIATPVSTQEPAEIPALPADATEEARAEHEKQNAARAAELAETNRKSQLATDERVDDFLYRLESQEGTFEDLAKEDGFELETTELFPLGNPPEKLRAKLRATSSEGTAADQLFRINVTSDPFSRISPAIAIGDNQWLIARVDEVEESRVQTYAEARDEARARLIQELATAALKKAAEEATTKISAALAEGKTFQEAVAAADITTEVVSLPSVTSAYQADTATLPSNLFQAAKYTNPGALAPPVIEADRAFIVHVQAREIVPEEGAAARVDASVQEATNRNQIAAFTAWLDSRNDAAKVEQLYNAK